MTIIGFSFKKISAERTKGIKSAKVNVANNVSLKKVEESEVPGGVGKQKALRFTYEYVTTYEPSIGNITIGGEVIYLVAPDVVEKTVKEWKKNKKIEKKMLTPILNTILSKCSIKGLIISQDLNLPSPVQLPRVTVK